MAYKKDNKTDRKSSMKGGGKFSVRRKPCYFCMNDINIIDFKDVDFLKQYQSDRGKILPRRQTFCCAKHQRILAQAVKRARAIGLLPFVTEG